MTEKSASSETASGDSQLERLLMRPRMARFTLWQALLAIIISILAAIFFATAAIAGAEGKLGPLGYAAHAIAEAPVVARRVFLDLAKKRNAHLARLQRFGGEAGLHIAPGGAPSGGALLISRYDGDRKEGIVEYLDFDNEGAKHVWRTDIDSIHKRSNMPRSVVNLRRDFNRSRYVYTHPLPFPDGSLIFHGMGSPLIKIDVCSRVQWVIDGAFHHSIERGADGSFWTAQRLIPSELAFVDDKFMDDAIVNISAEGEILFRKSVARMLLDSGLKHIVYSHNRYDNDPIHLNDIQPVPSDGPYWKKGDVFLSLRTSSVLLLYRPSTNEVVWSKEGPWLMQHDVDILSDHEIGVYSNNTVASPRGPKTIRPNEIMIYDFAADETRSPYKAAFKKFKVKTETSGLFRKFPDGSIMAEEHDYGRIVSFDATGALRWRYVNRAAKDGRVFQLGWSRFIDADDAEALKAAIEKADCGARRATAERRDQASAPPQDG